MYNDVATLINKVNTDEVDENGDVIIDEIKTDIFVNVKSVGMREFYTGQQAGYDPEIVFEIQDYFDYEGQPLIEHNDVLYKIIRTYRTNNGLEIVAQHYS